MRLPILKVTALAVTSVFAVALLQTACSTKPLNIASKEGFKPPLDHLDIPFDTYRFMAVNGGVFETSSGTKISIPENSFTDTAGNIVKGLIELNFREFHNAADIFVSGIPMAEKEDSDKHLETAGMFEIRATAEGKKIEMAPNKKLEVALASYVDDGCYNQFYLDEDNQEWELIADDYPHTNPEKIKIQEELEALKPALKMPLPDNYFAVNFHSAMDVFYESKYKSLSERKAKSKLKAYNLKWEDFYCRNTIKFRGKYMPASFIAWKRLSNKRIPKWAKNRTGDFQHVRGNTYNIVFTNYKTKEKFSFKAEAAMTLKSLFRKSASQWSKEYLAYANNKLRLEQKYSQAAELYRFFEVTDFGVYNSDRFLKQENPIPVIVHFEFEITPSADDLIMLNYITANNRSVIKFKYDKSGNHIAMAPGDRAIIFGVIPSTGETVIFSREDYNGIDFEALQKAEGKPSIMLKLKQIKEGFTSVDDIKRMLEEGSTV